jgi:dihydrofolate synthase/folylpolyglutamate synthase
MEADLAFTCLDDWLDWLEKQHPSDVIELGLTRIRQVAACLLDNRPIAKQVITVSGTNGKGSTIAYLGSILQQTNLRYGALTSPHLLRFNERISLHGVPVNDELLCAAFTRVNRARYQAGDDPVQLTYFEFNALLAFDLMQRAQLDVALLEIGLGGRLDAVNLIDADIAVLTSIGLDHQDWLGYDLMSIGREKAGIFRPGKTAICGDPESPASVSEYANQIGACILRKGVEFDASQQQWRGLNTSGQPYSLSLPPVKLPAMNVAAVVQAIKLLPFTISDQAIISGLQQARLAGRFQVETVAGKQVILDVAHNSQAAAHLATQLQCSSVAGRTWAVMAMLSDKDYGSVITHLLHHIHDWQLASTSGQRGLPASSLGSVLVAAGVKNNNWQSFDTVDAAFHDTIQRADDVDRIVVFGSFATVGAVLQKLQLY